MDENIIRQLIGQAEAVPWWNWSLQILGLLTSYVGAELNARQRVEGFHFWIVGNVSLAVLHAASALWALLLLDLLFFRVNLQGIRRWKRTSGDRK